MSREQLLGFLQMRWMARARLRLGLARLARHRHEVIAGLVQQGGAGLALHEAAEREMRGGTHGDLVPAG